MMGVEERLKRKPHPMSDFKDDSGAIEVAVTGIRDHVFIDYEKAGVLPGGSYRLIKDAIGNPVEIVIVAPNPEPLVPESGFTKEDYPKELQWNIELTKEERQ